MKTIAVLLTVFNRKEKTLSCLRNLSKQEMPNGVSYDVWLTNDGCSDGTPDAVREEFPYVHIIDGDGSLFWNRGMWTAWNAASNYRRYDFYLWLNDDTILYPHAIRSLLEESIKHNDQCNIVGSTQFFDHHSVSYGGFISHKVISPSGQSVKVDYFNGNIVLVPNYVFQKLGNLDYYYRHCHGDTDYGHRALQEGIESYIVGEYLGECDRNAKLRKCWDPDVPLIDRFKDLYKPTGYPPREAFYFQNKHYGFLISLFHIITLYCHVLFPGYWIKKGKVKP